MNQSYLNSVRNTVLSSKPSTAIRLLLMVLFVSITPLVSYGQSSQTFSTPGTYTFTVPCGVTSITVEVWGAGGGGHNGYNRGGGGGAFSQSAFSVIAGNTYAVTVGAGAASGSGNNGEDSNFANIVIAKGGNGGNNGNNSGRGGQASAGIGDVKYDGGNGGSSFNNGGAGGGAGAGSLNNGANGINTSNNNSGSNGGNGTNGGGSGGNGGNNNSSGSDGVSPGGGGGERGESGSSSGGGGNGQIRITYTTSLLSYCTPSFNSGVEPITNVTFAGINNTSTNVLGGSSLETFCVTGSVIQGSTTNAISVKGNTDGNYTDNFKVYIDWDQNGVFGNNANEITDIGTITNSTGIDAKTASANITVPATAILGTTKMRVVKVWNNSTSSACFSGSYYGQAEDYIINVTSPITITSISSSAGCVGSTITITGTNLSGATAANVRIGGTAVTSITSNTTTQIVAVVGNGTTGVVTVTISGNTATSASSFTVYPATVGGTVSGGTIICSGSTSALLTLSGHTGTIVKWQSAVSPFSTWSDIATTAATYTSGALAATTQFRAVVQNGSCATANSSTTTVTVNSTPAITPNKVDETCPISNNGSISPVFSGGLTNVRYIKLTQKHADHQQVAEIQAFQIFTGTNIALSSVGAVATSSSFFSSDYPVSEVNDGITATNGNMWHSSTTNINEWVQIDLQSGKNIDYLRIHNRTDCCQSRGQNMLLELFDASNNLVYSKTINLWEGVNGAHYVDVNVLDVSWLDGATTLNRTALDSGTYTLNYADAVGCPVSTPIVIGSTNTLSSAPTVTPTQPTCSVSTGAITVNTPLAATGITYTVTGTNPVVAAVTNATGVFSDLSAGTYDVTTTNACGTSTATSVTLEFVTNTWNGSVWSNGTPNSNQKIVFAGNYPPAVDPHVDITGCSCRVTGSTDVVIKTGRNLIITNEVMVVGTGTLTFENNASLVQINNAAVNSGNITYNRVTTTQVRNTDYTYWSTPVSPLKLAGVGGIAYSSLALTGSIFYSYLVTSTTEGWKSESASTPMVAGQGYGIRGPGAIATTPVGFLGVSFTGVPNNGNYSIPIAKTNASYLLGNPYPSAIDADAFLTDNSAVLDGTLYFWTHNSVIQDRNNIISTAGTGAYAYTSDDYAAYNKTGGTASALSDPLNPVGKIPTGKIAAGQGFFATSSVASGNIVFNNAMRLISNAPINNTQFFKTKNPNKKTTNIIEKHRIWLNMTNKEGAFKQTLVGYVTDATNDYDSRFDGESLDGNDFIDFYSINEDKNLVIQGRALPFDEKDEVPLGYKTTIEGDFTINIDETDGLLANQEVFLEDKLTNKTVNLKQGNYTFSTAAGTFDDRFVLKYSSKTLGVDSPQDKEDGIIALYSNADKTIIIRNNGDATIHSVSLFGMSGQNIVVWDLKNKEQTNIQLPTKELSSGIYILKMKTTTGESGKKIIVN